MSKPRSTSRGRLCQAEEGPGGLGAELQLGPPPCRAEAVPRKGVAREEAYRVFDMGASMALATDAPADLLPPLMRESL